QQTMQNDAATYETELATMQQTEDQLRAQLDDVTSQLNMAYNDIAQQQQAQAAAVGSSSGGGGHDDDDDHHEEHEDHDDDHGEHEDDD
ncbi:MAG: hypothetical protein KDI02_25190, partial [Anaerolineae bacterium]|nr:hypothetical protein [Anaerolineae bacterium]